jgi:hypothetical protein
MYLRRKRAERWDIKLTSAMIRLHKELWEGCNNFVHGKTTEEAQKKAREAVMAKVKETYKYLQTWHHDILPYLKYHKTTASSEQLTS